MVLYGGILLLFNVVQEHPLWNTKTPNLIIILDVFGEATNLVGTTHHESKFSNSWTCPTIMRVLTNNMHPPKL